MSGKRLQKILSASLLTAAIALLVAGSVYTREVYRSAQAEQPLVAMPPPVAPGPFGPPGFGPSPFGPPPFAQPPRAEPEPSEPSPIIISDRLLVRNATVGGVTREQDGLYLTYDPSKNTGKRACPT